MRKVVTINDWIIDLKVDDDGHLTLGIENEDESKVIAVEEDLASNDTEWVDRFTTEKIEAAYAEELDGMSDVEADADTLRSAGFGTDEDYGYYGDDE